MVESKRMSMLPGRRVHTSQGESCWLATILLLLLLLLLLFL